MSLFHTKLHLPFRKEHRLGNGAFFVREIMAREFAGNFYKTKDWKNLRELYAKSVGGICEICWQHGLIVPGEIVHHKIHLDEHNINDPNIALNMSNLQLVCRNCHAMLHKDEVGKRYRILDDGTVITT